MEDGAKEDPAQCKEPKFLAKAGWVKKAHGRVLASYKDRYIHVEKTEIVVYENEDLQNCLERFDLENFETCHEIKSTFKKKHRLIVIRSPKSGNKVHDLKFQTQTAEEKDAWIKALSDGISRAKNKVFDEVKVDDSSNLEHVTRSRPKGNRNRRPPTRIHMKEVAVVSSDGILRLDLDLDDAIMPNGTHHSTVDGTGTPKEASKAPPAASSEGEAAEEKSLSSIKEEDKPEPEASPQKKVIKPPMPPSKEAKRASAPEEEPEKTDVPEKKVLKPPMPPSKEAKPSAAPADEPTKEAKAEKTPETSPNAKKKTAVPPTPPSKPSSSKPVETSQSRPNSHPPTPPSKEKKPSHPAAESNQELQGTDDDNKEEDENPSPLLTSDKKEQDSPASDTSSGSLHTEEVIPTSDIPVVVVSLKDPVADSPSLSPLLGHLPGEKKKKKKAEEKSVDSGQHSDDDSEGSGSEDTLATSTAALRGSNAGLDVLDTSENDVQISVSLKPTTPATKGFTCWMSEPSPPIKPKTKVRSASSGNLLSDSLDRSLLSTALARSGGDEVMKLETEVALEMENTSKLLSSVSQSQTEGNNGEAMPEDLLAKAMEKLKKADHVLREVKKLKLAKDSNNRKSW
ncbi:pleckstrin homology domain-containing family O member 2 isoform X2 [Sphaeramia orbicularis]|uniref:PH domain-containing protein n=1 Tax=Sphaeramia orbicularis TaxID=375764 RepID=A0A672Y340_9TELE|nr:pleckstrin homology domain-containing family O member 2 isoform X2 [Sphaeramia orbicularis]